MYLETLRAKLEEVGLHSRVITTMKNSIPCQGLCLDTGDPSLSPVVYPNPEEPVESVITRAMTALEECQHLDPGVLFDEEYIREHAILSVQKKSCENVLKRSLLNLEVIVRVAVSLSSNEGGTIKVTSDLADFIGMDEDEVWDCAIRNTRARLSVRSMEEILGLSCEGHTPFYVVTTKDGLFGASALAFPELFEEFCSCQDHEHIFILPSSTEEVLILPDDDRTFSPEMLSAMVHEVNDEAVEEVLRLDPVVYSFDRGSGFILFADEAVCHG